MNERRLEIEVFPLSHNNQRKHLFLNERELKVEAFPSLTLSKSEFRYKRNEVTELRLGKIKNQIYFETACYSEIQFK